MALKSMIDVNEGWQAEKRNGQRTYHYIRETMALCGGLGFYTGDLVPDTGAPRDDGDCASCFRKLRGKQRQKKAAP